MLEDRAVPATLFVDNDLVAGTAIGSLASTIVVTNDRDASGTLTTGDQVTIANGETGQTANLTFNAAATGGDIGSAYGTISAALTAAVGGDTIEVAKGTYAENVTINKTSITIDGLTNNAADVVIDPAAGVGVSIAASGAALSDLTVTGSTDGIDATGVSGSLTLNNVAVNANSGAGLNLSGTGASASLTLANVSATGNTGAGMTISGFTTITESGLTLTGNSAGTNSSITAAAASTLNFTVGGATGSTITVNGTSLQITSGATTNQTINLSGVANVNVTGSSAADTFIVTAPATGGAAITINGGLPAPTAGSGTTGDIIDLTTVPASATVTSAFAAASGFGGSVASATTATVNFNDIEKFADGSTMSGTVTNQSAAGVAGVTVQLDINADGTADLTTTTNASGNFSFSGLPTGTYRVRIVVPSGDTQTSTNPADITVATLGQVTLPADFTLNVAATVGGTVTGVVFNDANTNGIQDGGEAGVSGVTVFLDTNGNGTLDTGEIMTTSGAGGAFTLTSTTNGTFNVRAVATGSFTGSTANAVSLTGGASLTSNVGLQTVVSTTGGTVAGVVFNDANKNGILDTGETTVSGVTVFLDANGNGTLDSGEVSTTSSAAGAFTLASSANGMFTLRAVPSGSFTAATSTAVNLSGGVTLTANVGLQSISAGTGGTVTGVVFNDLNGNGIKDGSESIVSGVTVFLDLNGNGQLNAGEPSAVSSATGAFSLTSTTNGQFGLLAVPPTGFKLGAIGTVVLNGGAPLASNIPLQAVTTALGGTVSGVVFADTNRNGIMDLGETGQSGVTLFLDADGDNVLDSGEVSTTSGAGGAFTLTSTTNGIFTVRAVEPGGFASSTDPVVTLMNGATLTANVGLLTAVATGGTVTGIVFNDKDRDGVMDAIDNPVRGVTVFLDTNNNGQLDSGEISTTTDVNGVYTLTTTTDGQAGVKAVLPVGYLHLSTTTTANLTSGATVTGANIGLFANLPPQATPSRRLAAGFLHGGNPHVKIFGTTGNLLQDIDVTSMVGAAQPRVAVADVTGDGVEDIIIGSGPGVVNKLVVLDGNTFHVIFSTSPFEATFTGGIFVAAGDVTGDGLADIIVTPDEGGGPRVEVFGGGNFQVVTNFFGIDDSNFRGGARASVADLNNDGVPDVIVAAGFGGGPRVAVFDGTTIIGGGGLRRLFNDFFVFEQTLRNGAFVTAGDVDGDGFADLIAGGGPGGAPRVFILSGADLIQGRMRQLDSFFAGDDSQRGGVRVTVKDLDGDGLADLVTGDGQGGGKHVKAFSGASLRTGHPHTLFDVNGNDDNNGVFVG